MCNLKPEANLCISDYSGGRVTLGAPAAALLMDWGHTAPVATAPECSGLSEPGSFRAELGIPKILMEQRTDHAPGEGWVGRSIGWESHTALSAATDAMSVAKHLFVSFFLGFPLF